MHRFFRIHMKVALGCNHRGFTAKRDLLPQLKALGHVIEDFGCHSFTAIDYCEIAYPLAVAVASHQFDLGVLIDCNGMGMSLVANKVRGVRAAAVYDDFTARCARESYHCNVIGIGAELVGGKEILKIVEVFLATTVATGRHVRRVEKLTKIEETVAHNYDTNFNQPLASTL
jgi:ribose 5-phosphate isomerase B